MHIVHKNHQAAKKFYSRSRVICAWWKISFAIISESHEAVSSYPPSSTKSITGHVPNLGRKLNLDLSEFLALTSPSRIPIHITNMDINSIRDQVSNLTLYDLKAGVRKVQNGKLAAKREVLTDDGSGDELHGYGGKGELPQMK